MRKAPPLPFLPAEWHGKEVLAFAVCYVGDVAKGEQAMAPLRALGKPIADVVGPHPFVGWQTHPRPAAHAGRAQLLEVARLHDARATGSIDVLVDARAASCRRPECEIVHRAPRRRRSTGSPIERDGVSAPRRPVRDERAHALGQAPPRTRRASPGRAQLFDALTPHATGGVYVNFMPEDETQRVRTGRLRRQLRAAGASSRPSTTPTNLFRMNQNILPGA